MEKKKNIFERMNLNSWVWIIGIIVLILFTYLNFNPTEYLRTIVPILFGSSFVLLGVFALTEIRKSIKEHYSRKTKNVLKKIEELREKQKFEELGKQITIDREILDLRESLRGFTRDSFEKSVIYSAILFAITLLLTYIDVGSYLSLSNLVLIIFFLFLGIYYFSKMINALFFALNIVKMD